MSNNSYFEIKNWQSFFKELGKDSLKIALIVVLFFFPVLLLAFGILYILDGYFFMGLMVSLAASGFCFVFKIIYDAIRDSGVFK